MAEQGDSGGGTPPSGPGGRKAASRAGSNTMDPLIGRVLLERYEVLRRIGSGGMGAVYVGRQLAIGREVALKILRQDLMGHGMVRERFRREAEIIGRLRHPNTIQLIDYGESEDGLAVMVMELLVGQPLSDRLKQFGPMPLSEVLEIGEELASSLAEAHALGLVHRDLKPANIFLVEVTGKFHAKVLDFGIARMLDEEASRITSTGQVFGTPRYMSPEQGLATKDVDHRSDLYSLGLILFECLAGQPPFSAQTSLQYLSAHATMPPPKLGEAVHGVPRSLEALVDRLLAKDPNERPASATEVEEGLAAIRRGLDYVPASARSDARASGPPPLTAPSLGSGELSLELDRTTPGPLRDSIAPEQPGGRVTAGPARFGWTIAAVGMLLLAVTVWAGATALRGRGTVVVDAMDLGVEPPRPDLGAAVLALGSPDATAPAPSTEDEDAGAVAPEDDAGSTSEDAEVDVAEDAGRRRPGGKKEPKRPGRPSDTTNITGETGPRAMWLPVEGQDESPAAIAARCKANKLPAGPAKLTLERCPAGCAVIVDGVCGGHTPVKELPVEDGNKNVTAICGGRIRLDSIARLRPDDTYVLRCQ